MITFLLCIKIFASRLIDVSLGTVRTIYTVKDKHLIASLVGFVEITVWLLVVQEVLNNTESNLWVVLSYALGFSVGTYIGGKISNYLINSKLGIQVIISKDDKILEAIRKAGYAVSVLNVVGKDEKYMLYLQIDSKQYNNLITIIKELDSKAFIVVNETKLVQNGYFKIIK